jgi:pimeloyl-ACP methyl ester carboxylesterase
MKSIRHFLGIFCLLIYPFLSLMAQQARSSPPSNTQLQYVDVGGYKLRMQVAGSGNPTVVLEAGGGGSLETWSDVFPEIARFTRVVSYDRAGLGKSELGPEPRSFTRYATELHTMLQRAGISPPYVLAGHSLGAGYLRTFAHLFKEEVAGLVFVDPFNEQIFRSMSAKEKEEVIAELNAELTKESAGQQAESRLVTGEILKDFPELRLFGLPPDVPMMLLVAGRRGEGVPGWAKAILAQYGTWMAEASEGGMVFDPESRHHIQRDNPALVISAIRRVVFPSVQNALERTIKEKGAEAAIALYRQMKQRYPAEFFRERTLNTLGYQQLRAKHVKEAIALFKLNVEMYPKSFNTYDGLAEAYMVQGDREAAVKNYKRSLALNPNNTNAVTMLKKLGAAP